MTDPTQYTPRNRAPKPPGRWRKPIAWMVAFVVVWLAVWLTQHREEAEPTPEPTWTATHSDASWRTNADRP